MLYKMRRQLLLLTLLLVLPIGIWADSNPTLLVLTKDGAQAAYTLSEKPQVKFEGKNLHIVSSKVDVTYALTDIIRFTYVDRDPSGIDELSESRAEIGYQDGTLTISQLKAGATVTVYGIDGKQVRQLKATRAGTYRLNLSALPQRVYIIKADTITYKIMKR